MSALPNEMSYVENKIHHMMISYLMWSNKASVTYNHFVALLRSGYVSCHLHLRTVAEKFYCLHVIADTN